MAASRALSAASAAAYLAMFAAWPASSTIPWSWHQAAFWVASRASSTSTYAIASGWASPWCAPMGTSQTFRSRAYWLALPRA